MNRIDALAPRRATTTKAMAVTRWTRLCGVLVTKRACGPTSGFGTNPITAAPRKAAANAHAKLVARFFMVPLLRGCEWVCFRSDTPSTPGLRTFLPGPHEDFAARARV